MGIAKGNVKLCELRLLLSMLQFPQTLQQQGQHNQAEKTTLGGMCTYPFRLRLRAKTWHYTDLHLHEDPAAVPLQTSLASCCHTASPFSIPSSSRALVCEAFQGHLSTQSSACSQQADPQNEEDSPSRDAQHREEPEQDSKPAAGNEVDAFQLGTSDFDASDLDSDADRYAYPKIR